MVLTLTVVLLIGFANLFHFFMVLDDDGNIKLENITGKQVWGMQKRRVMVSFNKRGQPIKDSGGLLGSWLGSLSYDLNILPINYTDWRKVAEYRKEMAWTVIQVCSLTHC